MLHVEIDMSEQGKEVLTSTLEKYLSELRSEIVDTDAEEYRDKLREEKRIIYRFLERLEEYH